MSVDIYAALVGEDGVTGPVMPHKHAELGGYDENGNWIANDTFVPGVAMTMCGSNWRELCVSVLMLSMEQVENMPLNELRMECTKALKECTDDYFIERLIQLSNICQLGITRGAKRLAVVR